MLKHEGHHTSETIVGRTLSRLRTRGQINEPPVVTAKLAGKKRQSLSKRPHAKQRNWSYVPTRPGDLVQVDTLQLRYQRHQGSVGSQRAQ